MAYELGRGAECDRCGLWVQEPIPFEGKLYGPVCIAKVKAGDEHFSTGADTQKMAEHYGVSPKVFRRKLRDAHVQKVGNHYSFDDQLIEKLDQMFGKVEEESKKAA